eukprot:6188890-Pleurochrysis_carterae.AAC.1
MLRCEATIVRGVPARARHDGQGMQRRAHGERVGDDDGVEARGGDRGHQSLDAAARADRRGADTRQTVMCERNVHPTGLRRREAMHAALRRLELQVPASQRKMAVKACSRCEHICTASRDGFSTRMAGWKRLTPHAGRAVGAPPVTALVSDRGAGARWP